MTDHSRDQKTPDWLRQLIEQKHAQAREEGQAQEAQNAAASECAWRDSVYESKADAFWESTVAEIEGQLSVYNAGVAGLPDKQVLVRVEKCVLRASAKTQPQRHLVCRFDRAGRSISAEYTFFRERVISNYTLCCFLTVSTAGELIALAQPPGPQTPARRPRIGFDVAPIEEQKEGTPVDVASAIVRHFLERV